MNNVSSYINKLRMRAIVAFAALSLGVYLGILKPQYEADRAYSALVERHNAVAADIETLSHQVSTRTWYKASYTEAVSAEVEECSKAFSRTSLDKTADLDTPQSVVRFVEQQEHALLQGEHACEAAKRLIAEQDSSRTAAAKDLERAQSVYNALVQKVGRLHAESETRLASFVSVYRDEFETKNSMLVPMLRETEVQLQEAGAHMPAADVVGKGDPTASLTRSTKALTLLGNVETSVAEGFARITWLEKAAREASTSLKNSLTEWRDAKKIIDAHVGRTGFKKALTPFLSEMDTAKVVLDEGTKALSQNDLPRAYALSEQARKTVVDASTNATSTVGRAESNAKALASHARVSDVIDSYVRNADALQHALVTHHVASEWNNVADTSGRIQKLKEIYLSSVNAASRSNSHDVQDFVAAEESLKTALKHQAIIEQEYKNLVERTDTLESARRSWPRVRSSAEHSIEFERSNVHSYGSYDYGAVSDFRNAEELYADALTYARSKQYERAVRKATEANQEVSGTGSRAYRAYEEYERRKRREAEEAARVAAEVAARALESSRSTYNDSSSSYDYGGGSYGSGSSSSSNDGGDWGGGSSSSDGGDW